jgi:hypothetical protein
VEMLLHDPNRELHTPDGTVIGPYSVGFYRTKMTVEWGAAALVPGISAFFPGFLPVTRPESAASARGSLEW